MVTDPHDIALILQNKIPVMGIALTLCIIAGKLAKKIKLPKVTAFIFVGVILGPSFTNLLPIEMTNSLNFLNEIALGLILFNIGGEFNRELFKKMPLRRVRYSLMLSTLIVVSVSAICFLFNLLSDVSIQQNFIISTFLGIVALSPAPLTTMLVMKEYDAKGSLSESIVIFLAVGTGMAIILAQIFTVGFEFFGLWEGSGHSMMASLGKLLWAIFGSIFLGMLLGFLLSYREQKEKKQSEMLLAVICTIMVGQSLSFYLETDSLLISLVLGFTLVNTSKTGKEIHDAIKDMGLTLYAIFFVLAGAHIHFQVQMKTMGVIGVGYLIARTVGIMFSSYVAGKFYKEDKKMYFNKGLAILSHAGAALAIILKLNPKEETAQVIIIVITASIFVFEVVGPLCLKFALISANEIIKGGSNNDGTARLKISLTELVENFFRNLGLSKDSSANEIQNIRDLVKKDMLTISASTTVPNVLKFVQNHAQTIYPVVDEDNKYIGLINLNRLNDTINEDNSNLILARSVILKAPHIHENATFQEAVDIFHREDPLEVLPVVQVVSRELIGFVTYKEVVFTLNDQGPNLFPKG